MSDIPAGATRPVDSNATLKELTEVLSALKSPLQDFFNGGQFVLMAQTMKETMKTVKNMENANKREEKKLKTEREADKKKKEEEKEFLLAQRRNMTMMQKFQEGFQEKRFDRVNDRWNKRFSGLEKITGIKGEEMRDHWKRSKLREGVMNKVGGIFGKKDLGTKQLGKWLKLSGKKGKLNPSASDVSKEQGGIGFLFLWNKIKKKMGLAGPDTKKDKGGGGFIGFLGSLFGTTLPLLLKKLFPKLLPKILPFITKALPFAVKALKFLPVIGTILSFIIDGVMGLFKAKEWGTSQVSATVAGVLGGTGSGWANALGNAAKFAVAGFLVGGPIGAAIGAVIGGILGFIGGEKIAQWLDDAWAWGVKAWADVSAAVGSVGTWLGDNIFGPIGAFAKNTWDNTVQLGKDFIADPLGTMNRVADSVLNMLGPVGQIAKNVKDGLIKDISALFGDPVGTIKAFAANIGLEIKKFADSPWKYIQNVFTGVIKGIENFFKPITDFFGYATDVMGREGLKGLVTLGSDVIGGELNTKSQAFGRVREFEAWRSKQVLGMMQGGNFVQNDLGKALSGYSTLTDLTAKAKFLDDVANKVMVKQGIKDDGGNILKFHQGGQSRRNQLAMLNEDEMVFSSAKTTSYMNDQMQLNQMLVSAIRDLTEQVKSMGGGGVQQTVINRYSPASMMNAMGAT
jgi:hypothetical protein